MHPFMAQTAMTAPGRYAAALESLPDDIEAILNFVRGHFVHCDYLSLYGLDGTSFAEASRETLSLEERLDKILEPNARPLTDERPPKQRQVGTCRDYAVMLCGLLREKSIPARIRCGFARYFVPEFYQDHWLCEYWHVAEQRWARADAQLDGEHRRHLGIAFDTADLPEGEFLTAREAWQRVRSEESPAASFGHGDATGAWFLWVNLARDCLALQGQEVSFWDTWRRALGRESPPEEETHLACDRLSNETASLEAGYALPNESRDRTPFWS